MQQNTNMLHTRNYITELEINQGGKTMTGKELKEIIQSKRLYQWEVAQVMNINEFTLSRWLRGDVLADKEVKILAAIELLEKGVR